MEPPSLPAVPMDVSYLLDSLNDKQREAVAASRTNMLVLAGAGSGKTRVLVHRIAWLLSVENCSPYSIMAVTFTNKAAAEMRHRIGQLMGTTQGGMWVGTFHGLAHRLLRAHHLDANLPQDFQILDSEDQLRLLKRLIKAMNLDEKQWPPRQAMWYINSQKDEGLRPHHIQSYGNPVEQTWQKVYQAYQEACDRAGLVDFAELLLRAHELWLNKPHILQHYRERFTNILVDEFEDTNNIQYARIRLLAGDTGKVMIVGDDDQSIYGWRGAQVENIQRFLNDFPGAETIRLEQNYRSTSNILSAANALIENNNGRLGKKLWTDGADGEAPFRCTAPSTILMKRVSWLTELKPGRRTAERWSSAPFSIVATPSRACWKRRCYRPACRTVSTAACASSNVRKSKMRSLICV